MTEETIHNNGDDLGNDLLIHAILRTLEEITHLNGSQTHAITATFRGAKTTKGLVNQSTDVLTFILEDLQAIKGYVQNINKEWEEETN